MSETFLETRTGRRIRLNTPDEEAKILAGAMSDPDSRPLTDEEWERVLPTVRVGLRGRPLKSPVTLRLDADIAATFRSSGRGWQTRINEILREWLKSHEMAVDR
ncbi:MAG: BrnA antitoxin family protein [Azoarcus sp.]|jgi:uncharacterized protein (DUF4415 family)|nr:BrnA antitoxin family protein [Azoarcus sp.]